MAVDLAELIGPEGWGTATALLSGMSRRTLQTHVGAGRLVRLSPGCFALAARAGDWRVRAAVAVGSREAAALSHVTALATWGLVSHPAGPVHLTVDTGRSVRGAAGIVVHHAPAVSTDVRRVRGLAVTPVERAVVDTWGSPAGLARGEVRGAAITAVRRRMCSADDLRYELARSTRLPGRAGLAHLAELLAAGCQSELEIWGCENLLTGRGMPTFVRQRPVTVRGERFFLDAACEEAMLAVELDGAAWHGSREQRERDIRRDALLATVGWQTMRFGYRRLLQSLQPCREEIITVAAARTRQLRGDRLR